MKIIYNNHIISLIRIIQQGNLLILNEEDNQEIFTEGSINYSYVHITWEDNTLSNSVLFRCGEATANGTAITIGSYSNCYAIPKQLLQDGYGNQTLYFSVMSTTNGAIPEYKNKTIEIMLGKIMDTSQATIDPSYMIAWKDAIQNVINNALMSTDTLTFYAGDASDV